MIQEVQLSSVVGAGNDVHNLRVTPTSVTCNGQSVPRDPFNSGLRLIGDGHNILTTQGGISYEYRPGSGFVELVSGTIKCSGWMGFKAGEEFLAAQSGDLFSLNGTTIEGNSGTFGGHSRNADLLLKHVTFDCDLGQHDLYAGGWGEWGAWLEDCTFLRSGAEGAKFVTRPGWESLRPHESDWQVTIKRTTFENCESGIVIQGAGANILLEEVTVTDCGAPLRIDNGLSPNQYPWSEYNPATMSYGPGRYWDHYGVIEGSGSANRALVLDKVILAQKVGGSPQLMRIGKEVSKGGTTWPHTVCLVTTIRNSGFYGLAGAPQAYVSIPAALTLGAQTVYPTPASIDAYAASLGIDTSAPAAIYQ